MGTDVVCQECGRSDHFEAPTVDELVAAVLAAGWFVTVSPPARFCPDHAPLETADV